MVKILTYHPPVLSITPKYETHVAAQCLVQGSKYEVHVAVQ